LGTNVEATAADCSVTINPDIGVDVWYMTNVPSIVPGVAACAAPVCSKNNDMAMIINSLYTDCPLFSNGLICALRLKTATGW